MTGAWLLPVISAAMLGSLHCVGMCGGLIAVAGQDVTSGRQRLLVQASYQGARLLSYVSLGALAGLIGRAIDVAGEASGIGKTAAIVAGASMTLGGLLAMLEAAGTRFRLPQLGRLPRSFTALLARPGRPPLMRAALLGGASALLPCGFLYAFALAGAATGSPLGGALVMTALWLGNLPALLGFGLLLSTALARLRRHLPLFSAASVFVLGLLTLSARANVPALAACAIDGGSAARQPLGSMPANCPCHRRHQP